MKSGLVAAAFLLLAAAGAWFLVSRSASPPVFAPAPPAPTVAPAPAPVLPTAAPASPAPAPKGAVLSGRVLTADEGKPVAGARVEVEGCEASATTGADGAYRIEGIPPGKRVVEVLPAEHAPAAAEVEFAEGKAAARDLFVLAGAVVEGRVTFDGSPVPGAVVATSDETKSCTTGMDGTFRLRGFPPGDACLWVKAVGSEEQSAVVDVPPGVALVRGDIELREPWTVRGVVLDGEKPVVGALVIPYDLMVEETPRGGVGTAFDGTFVLTDLDAIENTPLYAWMEEVGYGLSEPISMALGTTLDSVVVRILPASEAAVQVVDGAGRPVAAVTVEARRVSLNISSSCMDYRITEKPDVAATTDAAGRCALRLQPGDWEVRAARDGSFAAVQRVEVPREPGHLEVPLALHDGGDLAGRVTDAEGRPVAAAQVSFPAECPRPEVSTDGEGRFLFRGLPNEDLRLRVEKEGFVATTLEGVRPGPEPVKITLPRGSRVRGTVVLADGKTPVRACTVRLYFRETEEGKPWEGGMWPFRELDVNDADGRFELPDVEAGTIAAEAVCGDLLSARVDGIRTAPGKDPPEVRLVLKRGAVLKGTVRDPKGQPLPGVQVGLDFAPAGEDEDCVGTDRDATTDAEGRYEFRVVPAGRYMLRVEHGGFFERIQPVEVEAGGEKSSDIPLSRGGLLQVRCEDSEGKPLLDYAMDFTDEKGAGRSVQVVTEDETGSTWSLAVEELARSPRLAPDEYRAKVTAEGFEPAPVKFTIREGETTSVRVVLKKP